MTRLFNLESYSDFCSYTQIFGQLSQPLESGIPVAYQSFLTSVRDFLFLQPPIVIDELPNPFLSRKEALNFCTVGIELDDQKNENLLIVRDIDVLSLRHLKERYLYASAYRYWNFVSQFSHLAESKKPLVIYDLDSLPCPYYLPISFTQDSSFPHPIPILDTRKVEDYEKLKLPFNNTEIYDLICDRIARLILISHANVSGIKVNNLIQYLKRINIFAVIKDYLNKNPDAENMNILIEIPYSSSQNLYLSTILKLKDIEEIILQVLAPSINTLKLIAENHPQYNFVLISQYNYFPKFFLSLKYNFLLPDINCPEFKTVWQQKLLQNFPLYGQYLDQISFEVGEDWIDVPSVIDYANNTVSYEGDTRGQEFVAKYLKDGQIIEQFKMDTLSAQLPIKINGKILLKNNKEQAYELTNLFYQEDQEIKVKIRFLIRLGYPPILKVEDEKQRMIKYDFVDAQEIIVKGYLPIKDIQESRYSRSDDKINLLDCLNLNQLKFYLSELTQSLTNKNLIYLIGKIHKSWKSIHRIKINNNQERSTDPLMYILQNSTDKRVIKLKTVFKNINITKFAEFILDSLDNLTVYDNSHYQDILTQGVVLLGKTYMFSQEIPEEILLTFFDKSYLIKISKFKTNDNDRLKTMDEYWRFLARIASTSNLQLAYFKLFFEDLSYGKAYFSDVYLWGYSRILLWYSDFNYYDYTDYIFHAREIITRLTLVPLPINLLKRRSTEVEAKNYQYKQNAFLALIYLLTFRAKDRKFFAQNTPDFKNAHNLISIIENRGERIILKAVSETKTLTQIYSDFLNQVETSEDIERIKKIE